MWPIGRPPPWVGRTQELAVLRAGAEALRRGEGAVVWVEGEPGIGKSSLVAEALAEAGARRRSAPQPAARMPGAAVAMAGRTPARRNRS